MATITATSIEYVDATVTVDDLTATALRALTVHMAFTVPGVAPASGDWLAAGWAAGSDPARATILVGAAPGVIALPAGTWQVWVRVQATPSVPVIDAGFLYVDAGPWSYSGDPSTSDVDACRFWLDDTASPALFSNAELTWLIAQEGSALEAAASAAERLAFTYAKRAETESVGDVSKTWGGRADAFVKLAAGLRSRVSTYSPPSGLGLLDDWNSTRMSPAFWRGIHDHPESPGVDTLPA